MKKKFLILFGLFILTFVYFTYVLLEYLNVQKHNYSQIKFCSNEKQDCFNKMFELILPELLIHKVKINSKTPELLRLDWSARLMSDYALSNADVLVSYGVGDDLTFENTYIKNMKKPVYAFDCGVTNPPYAENGCNFYSECIETDTFITEDKDNYKLKKVHTYKEMIDRLNLSDKKIFIKMDIIGAEKLAIPQILDFSDNITGMVICFYFSDTNKVIEAIPVLEKLNKKFVLISRISDSTWTCPINIKSKYFKGNSCNYLFALSYVNKNLVDKDEIPFQQKTTELYKHKSICDIKYRPIIDNDISSIVVIVEKLKRFKKQLFNN